MLEPLFNFFERLVVDFSWKRVLLVASVMTLVLAALYLFETQSGYFEFQRMERQVSLLEKLGNLAKSEPFTTDPELKEILSNLKARLMESSALDPSTTELSDAVKKSLAAAVAWIAMAVVLLFAQTRKPGANVGTTLVGVVVLALPFVALAAFLPSFEASWINYFLYPVGHVILVMLVVTAWHQRKLRRNAA